MKEKCNIIPTILGLDLNAYSVAVAFHSAYGVKSHAFGRYRCGLSDFSRIIKIEFCSGFESIDQLLPELISFAKKNSGKKLILVPAGDSYVEFVSKNAGVLKEYYSFLVPGEELIKKLTNKASFYRELSRAGIDYPEFIELNSGDNYHKKLSKISYPAVIKPSLSAEYWRHPFPDMRKVYYPADKDEAANIISKMRYYGYEDGIILQRLINKPEIYVYTALYNEKSELDFGVFGKVVLEEAGKTSSGNHSAIITEERCELCCALDKLLGNLGYSGFANFDILKSDGKYYVLELNARQGRSCDYIRCAGINIAKRLLFNLGISEDGGNTNYEKIFWHYPPVNVALKYMNRKDKEEAESLRKLNRGYSALSYQPDLIFNPIRASYVLVHTRRLAQSFKKIFENFEE
ncbi:MAG: hypothetical protein IJW38_01610 [Clostridia bacterium]|nr:hypothetical protein [Clostridia bacterium]